MAGVIAYIVIILISLPISVVGSSFDQAYEKHGGATDGYSGIMHFKI
jgi:hypothetical protein